MKTKLNSKTYTYQCVHGRLDTVKELVEYLENNDRMENINMQRMWDKKSLRANKLIVDSLSCMDKDSDLIDLIFDLSKRLVKARYPRISNGNTPC